MTMFANAGKATLVDSGNTPTSAVHVDDAATLYLLAAEKAKAGDVFNGVSGNVTFRALTEAMAKALGLPVHELGHGEAEVQFGGFFARFLSTENWASGAKARKELGWDPKGADIIDEVETGSYATVVQDLKKTAAP